MVNLKGLNLTAAERIRPFLIEVLDKYHENIHSIYITGTSLTDDFDPRHSDINSIFLLKEMDLNFLSLVAPLGRRYCRKRVAAPLIMTPEYIKRSLDVFPIEFLNFKLIHTVVFGDDLLKDLEIKRIDLRYQCERELKARLIWLRQVYISTMGDTKVLDQELARSITGYIPLFRGIITLYGKEPPITAKEVITILAETVGIETDAFSEILRRRRKRIKPSKEEVESLFKEIYLATERLGRIVDGIEG